jgi:hypothetical protein
MDAGFHNTTFHPPECASLRGASPIIPDFSFCVFAVGDNLAEETQLGEEILSKDYAKK